MAAENQLKFVVVGGGIAGVSCAEQLSFLNPGAHIVLVSASRMVKAVTNFKKVSRALETFDVEETATSHLTSLCPNVTVINSLVQEIDSLNFMVKMSTGVVLHYDKLCLCAGATPNVVIRDHPRIIGIRDTESVQYLQDKIKDSRCVVVLGNGGIAIELVYELSGCHVIWAIKDSSIGSTFFDEGAAKFFLPHLQTTHHSDQSQSVNEGTEEEEEEEGGVLVKTKPLKRMKYMLDPVDDDNSAVKGPVKLDNFRPTGSALGPDWSEGLAIQGHVENKFFRNAEVEYQCQLEVVMTPDEFASSGLKETGVNGQGSSWPLYVKLDNGKVFGCDLVISATGVVPNAAGYLDDQIKLSDDGGVLVDSEMRTTAHGVYAAGDVCSVYWPDVSRLWFQMRLWSQARQMGAYAAKCMTSHAAKEPISLDFCFELFAHVTKFFGYKVVLLGRYNAQDLGNDYEILLRVTEGVEYVKVVLQNGRMVGAILIGDTDLEETFENLMLNQMDLSPYGDAFLDPNIDIEDYFD